MKIKTARLGGWAAIFSATLALSAVCGGTADAQQYPTRTITVIIPFAGGSASDVVSRIMLDKMSKNMGQAIVVENRPGAGGNSGTLQGARSTPDGYTLIGGGSGPVAANLSLYNSLGYDPEKDFEPISLIGTQTNLLYTHPGSVPATTLPEFVAYVKANPGKLTFGSGGIGTPAHLAGELLKVEAGIEMTHAPFRGTGQALQSVIGGHVPVAFNPPSPLLPHLESGALRAIAVTTLQRTSALPNVLTIAESGYPGFDAATWHAIVAPAAVPKDVLAALYNALHETLNDAATRKALTDLGVDVVDSSPDQLRAYIKSEIPKWAKVVKASGAKVE